MQPSQQMIDNETGRYLPVIYPEELPYWEGARKRQLVLQCCKGCGKAWYPIGPACRAVSRWISNGSRCRDAARSTTT